MYEGINKSLTSKKLASFDVKFVIFIKLPVEFVIMHQGDRVTINEHESPFGSGDESS